jgi:hypothetical protein
MTMKPTVACQMEYGGFIEDDLSVQLRILLGVFSGGLPLVDVQLLTQGIGLGTRDVRAGRP